MKKNGFTLIEVTAVVIILALLTVIIVPKVNNTIRKNKEKVCASIKVSAEDGAQTYAYAHINEIDTEIDNNGYAEITLLKLMQEGLMKKELINPYNNEPISTSNVVRITRNGNSYEYLYTGVDCK